MTDQRNGTAIVTGASKGLGAAIAERLARDGFAVAVNYSSGADTAREVVERITASGGRALAVQADVSNAAAITSLFDRTAEALGECSVLVNNAGFMHLAPIAELEDADLDRLLAVNVKGVFNGMREAAKRLPDGGRIISLSSSANGAYLPGYGGYVATKAAVEGLSHVLAKELGARRISVNVVAPGPTATDLFFQGKTDEQVKAISRMIPFGRIGEPKDIADIVSFLAGPDGGWVNGQVLRANGGMI
ncbi:SDR family oxidoreductase [Lichenicoccus sp.]|uniref:SDR family oxidoreductase n=1 Tax=Lichenicoccus sp. TaxID=2781899 RepID=UPI003D0B51EF